LQDSEEVNAQVKHLHRMLDVATMGLTLITEIGGRVRTLTTVRACTATRPAASHPQWSVTKIRMKETCATLSATEMHVIRSKIGTKNKIMLSANDTTTKGTMLIMTLIMTSPTGTVL
jgi:CBS domain containing-hemolysin-like protein